jgi:DNA mismatch endonuclease, patch repair protein
MDRVDKATRSRIMAAIRSKDTKPELALAAALQAAGVAFERHGTGLPGTPDFIVPSARLAVFCHGCFWHLCRLHYKPPVGPGFRAKMDRNRRRDIRVRRRLRRLGWQTMVVWEHEDMTRGAARVVRRLSRIGAQHERIRADNAAADAAARHANCRRGAGPSA